MGRRERDPFNKLIARVTVPEVSRTPTLDDEVIAKLPTPGRREQYPDPIVPGLKLRVTPTGVKAWSLWYRSRLTGRARMLTLGRWPDVLQAQAQELAKDVRARDRLKLQPEAALPGATLRAVAHEYLTAAKPNLRPKTFHDYSLLIVGPLQDLGGMPLADLSRANIRMWHERISAGRPIQANRALGLLQRILNWALDEGRITSNPALRVPRNRETSRSRILRRDEIRALWYAWLADDSSAARALRLILATAQRKSEVLTMQRAAIDADEAGLLWWTIPAERSKNGQPHRVPLFSLASKILDLQPPGEWVFPAVKPPTVAAVVRPTPPHLVNLMRAVHRSYDLTGIRGWTPHDLRRTAASYMAQLRIPTASIAHVLNHLEPGIGVTAIYIRGSFDPQKAEALAAWNEALIRITDPHTN